MAATKVKRNRLWIISDLVEKKTMLNNQRLYIVSDVNWHTRGTMKRLVLGETMMGEGVREVREGGGEGGRWNEIDFSILFLV